MAAPEADGRVLLLVRHAKAVAHTPTDVERTLSGRGRRDAAAAGIWLAEQRLLPDRVIVSPAVRARETWAGIAAAISVRVAEPRIDSRVYDNTVDDLLAVLRELTGDDRTVAVVGHNPSMHGLAVALDDGGGAREFSEALAGGYPTCGIAVFDVAGPWSEVAPGAGRLRTFTVPRG